MHIITRKKLKKFWQDFPDSEAPLKAWVRIVTKSRWRNPAETRAAFPGADLVCECTIFNIGSNKFRLVCHINYRRQKVYILHILTHREYDKGKWKDDCYC
ncbi:MAG: type II toxin-antitoxin system HigB family toxin [Acidobacteriota bacterium]|nr:MAG: type II toxin-antitoxin system HigB family toxin [Acidobacteriota bacterium]